MTAKRTRNPLRGTTLTELMVTCLVFSLLLAVLFHLFRSGTQALLSTQARHQAQLSLNKVHEWLQRDLQQASSKQIAAKRVSAPAGNGDALWFLSAENPTESNPDLRFRHSVETGTPIFQSQILYYLVRPLNYSRVSGGLTAAVDPDPDSDFYAPHKFLIRKVIDRPEDPEILASATEVDDFTTSPLDYTMTPLNLESNLLAYKLVSDNMLSFQVVIEGSTVLVRTSALKIDEARRRIAVGNISLKEQPLTVVREARYELRN